MRYHLYNLNINDDFKAGIYRNSVQVFLGGLVDEAKKSCEVSLYGMYSLKGNGFFYRNFSFILSRLFVFRALINFVKSAGKRKGGHVFIVLGYDFLVVVQLIVLRAFGFKVFCYIFDSHKLSLEGMGCKKNVVDLYYRLGFFLARWLSAVICVNDSFPDLYGKNFKRIIRSKIGYSGGEKKTPIFTRCEGTESGFNVVFGGTLNYDNGAHIVLQLIRKEFPFDVRFKVYGKGPLDAEFIKLSNEFDFVEFFGEIGNSEVLGIVRAADVCLNLRDPNSENKNLAFPSKLIEYFFNSDFVVSNRFPALGSDLVNSLVGVCEFTSESLYRELVLLYEGVGELECKARRGAIDNLRREYSWSTVFSLFHDDICNLTPKS